MQGLKLAQLSLTNKTFLDKLMVAQSFKKFPSFSVTQKLISMSTKDDHSTLSQARLIQSTSSYPIQLRCNSTWSHLRPYLPKNSFTLDFPPKIIYEFHISLMLATCLCTTCLIHLHKTPLRVLCKENQSWVFSLCNSIHPPSLNCRWLSKAPI